MNIKIIAESKQEEILYTPYHISYNLTGYTRIVVMRNYVIKSCSPKDIEVILGLSHKYIAYFFFGNEYSWINLFRSREPDYVGFNDAYLMVLDKHHHGGYVDVTLSVHVSFILYVEDNPRLDWATYLFTVFIILALIAIGLSYKG